LQLTVVYLLPGIRFWFLVDNILFLV